MQPFPRSPRSVRIWERVYRVLGWAVVVIPVGVLCLIGFGLLTLFNGDLATYVGVTHQPESELFYPGAVLVRNRARGDHTDAMFGRYYPASTSSVLRTDAAPPTIREWYRARLTSDGWTDDGDGTSYHRPGRRILLFFVYDSGFYGYAFGFTDCRNHQPCDTDFPPE
jgi:hypothetical protein